MTIKDMEEWASASLKENVQEELTDLQEPLKTTLTYLGFHFALYQR